MKHFIKTFCLTAFCLLALLVSTNLNAQKPVVAILTWDEKAKEASDPGEIWIVQLGEPTQDLTVKIKILLTKNIHTKL